VPSHYYFVLTRPKPGQDQEYNDRYSNIHIHDLVAIPGIVAARRFKLFDRSTQAETGEYLAIYELSDIDLAISGIAERRGTDRMPSSDAIDRDASRGVIFRPLWDAPASWQFARGALDLLRIESGRIDPSRPTTRLFRATDKQSRPGPPAFAYAAFREHSESSDVATLNAALEIECSGMIVSRISALMDPITERVTAA
jgi:hypothetical protein